MDDETRQIKEDFVSNLTGTTWHEVDAILVLPSIFIFVNLLILSCTSSLAASSNLWRFVVEHAVTIYPLLFTLTVWSAHLDWVAEVAFCVLVITLLLCCKNLRNVSFNDLLSSQVDKDLIYHVVSWYRGIVNILTAICILAVDFHIYPRRLAKTENSGCGLMDIFVGSFIMCNAIVSSEARDDSLNYRSAGMKLRSMWSSVRSTLPLIVLGLCRLLSVKFSNYQEHVTEYGVHWNFFMTLALTKILSKAMTCLFKPRYCLLIALSSSLFYQYLLSSGLATYILQPGNRQASFLLANREGIFSLIGYIAIYFFGVAIGQKIFSKKRPSTVWNCFILLVRLTVMGGISIVVVSALQQYAGLVVSRRLVNLPFIIWTVHHAMFSLAGLIGSGLVLNCVSIQFKDIHLYTDGGLLMAVNYNGLGYFLIANLCTGIVNLLTDTLTKTPIQSILILITYMTSVNMVITFLYKSKVRIKFW